MSDNAGDNSERLKREMSPVKEVMGPPPPKKKHTKEKEEDGVSHLDNSAQAEGEGATVGLVAPEEIMEKDQDLAEDTLSKCIPSEQAAGASATLYPLASLSEDYPGSSGDWLLFKPCEDAAGEGDRSINLSTGYSKFKAMPAPWVVPASSPARPGETIADVKCELRKEIRKMGRKYGMIFYLLEEVERPLEVKKELVEFSIKEAMRFKRRDLINHLEKILSKIEGSLNRDTH